MLNYHLRQLIITTPLTTIHYLAPHF